MKHLKRFIILAVVLGIGRSSIDADACHTISRAGFSGIDTDITIQLKAEDINSRAIEPLY